MNHYTVLGCDDVFVSMLFEILSTNHGDQIHVDIIKNMKLKGKRYPYKNNNIVSREIDAEDWEINRQSKYLLGVIKPASKQIVLEYFSKQFSLSDTDFTILIHKHTSIASTVEIDNGVIISPGVVIAPYTKVDRSVTIARNVSLGHHSIVGEFTRVNPGANIAGHCIIGKNVTIGMGAVIIDGVSIGNNSIIGGGSLVTKSIPENVMAYGSPAKGNPRYRMMREMKNEYFFS